MRKIHTTAVRGSRVHYLTFDDSIQIPKKKKPIEPKRLKSVKKIEDDLFMLKAQGIIK